MAYSTCIARVFFNIRESRIRGVFRTLNIGEIERVDMIKKSGRDGKNFWCVFIHWKNLSAEVRDALDKKGGVVTIEYDEPWYWKMTKSHSRRPVKRSAPKISIGAGSGSDDKVATGANAHTASPTTGGSDWVDVDTAAPSPLALSRQPSNTAELIEGSNYDPALQPDEELRGSGGPTTPPGTPTGN